MLSARDCYSQGWRAQRRRRVWPLTRAGTIYLGFILTVGAFPVALLRLIQHRPWPWVGIFGALAMTTLAVAVWSLIPRRRPGAPHLKPKAGPHPVRRASTEVPHED